MSSEPGAGDGSKGYDEEAPLVKGRSSSNSKPGRAKNHPMRQCILFSFGVIVMSLCSMFFVAGFAQKHPLMGFLFLASIVPSFFIIYLAYRKSEPSEIDNPDDPEAYFDSDKVPIEVLIIGFTAGVFVTIPIAMIGIGSTALMKSITGNSMTFAELSLYLALEIYVFVALMEEGGKLFVAKYSVDRESLAVYINHPYGVVLYALCGALGFAGIENVMYVFQENSDAGWYVAIARSLMSVPLHGACGAIIGVGLARRIYLKDPNMNYFRILIIPILIHGTYDYLFVLPFRNGDFDEGNRAHELQSKENTVDIGDWMGFLFLFNICLVFFGGVYAKYTCDQMLDEYRLQKLAARHGAVEDA